MIEKGKIGAVQMAVLLYLTIIATAILLVPAITGKFAHQDMWLSPLWGSCTGFISIYIAYRLHTYYPEMTLIQYSEKIIGKIPGKIISSIFLLFFLLSNALILREYGEFVVGNFLISTPIVVVIASLTFVCALAVQGGLEVVARSAQMIIPFFVVLFLLIVVFLIPELEPKNMLPIMEDGIGPSLMGAIIPGEWFTQFFLISFIFPYLGKKEKKLRWGMFTVLAAVITLFISNLISLLLLGDITSNFTYPFLTATRYINIADFIQNVEAVVMAIWVAGIFIKVTVFYYVVVIGTAQWLELSDYKPVVWPIGFLLVILSIWSTSSLQELTHFLSTSWQFLAYIVKMLIPILLLCIAIIRKKSVAPDS